MKIAVQLAQQHADYADIRRAASTAEDLGADLIVNWDHFQPLGQPRDGKHFECWTMLGAWAESTSRAQIGAMVSCVGYRNPDLLADMARTVDHISGGRLVLGLGSGFREQEFIEYGYRFGTPGERVADLAVALERISQRFAKLNPAPTRKIPLLVAGDGRKTLGLVARYADIWHTFAEGDELTEKSATLDALCRAAGRDPASIERSVFVHDGPEKVTLPDAVTQVTVFTRGPEYDFAVLKRWLELSDCH